MNKLTALIITLNEEKHIGACIESLRPVADEILIIDSLSADGTVLIAEAKGVKVIEEKFEGFGRQKNMGAAHASHDLILSVDADEVLSEELQRSILEVKKNHTVDAYSLNILNHIGSRAVKGCGWYPDVHVRIYDRRNVKWNERKVHESLMVTGDVKHIHGDLLHFSYENIQEFKKKSEHYARLGAEVHRDKNQLILFIKTIFSPIFKFIKVYFLKKGFSDGNMGLQLSYYMARETFLKYYWAIK